MPNGPSLGKKPIKEIKEEGVPWALALVGQGKGFGGEGSAGLAPP
jgi:hypothetical protein